ncbi:MAG TPA: hypothetical protein ENJ82_02590, partial [Bacteroidetes bacterium]|nr:hypothetical protein [Bacteroidota bacterium]
MSDQSTNGLNRRKPFRLLKVMSKKDIDIFRQFLMSPIYNPLPDKKLIEFFEHCQRHEVWSSDIGRSAFLEASGLNLNSGVFDKRISSLNTQLTRFAGAMQFAKDDLAHWPYAITYFKQQNLDQKEIDAKHKAGVNKIKKQVQDEAYFTLLLKMDLENYSISRALSPELRDLPQLHKSLDHSYIIQKLSLLCASTNEQTILATSPQKNDEAIRTLMDWMQVMYSRMPTLATVYYHAYYVLIGQYDEIHYRELRVKLREWEAETKDSNRTEFSDLYGYMINYCLRKSNSGASDAIWELDTLFQESLNKGYILTNGLLPHEHFTTILKVKCRLNLLEEARAFWKQYAEQLTDSLDGAAAEVNEIFLLFHGQQYKALIEKAEPFLEAKGAMKADQYYGISLRLTLLQTYFEYLVVLESSDYE